MILIWQVPTVIPHFRASSGIPSLTGRRSSLSPNSLSPVHVRPKRRDTEHGESMTASLVRNPQSVSNRYLPKSPGTYSHKSSKLLAYFPIEKANYSGSSIPVSIRPSRPLPSPQNLSYELHRLTPTDYKTSVDDDELDRSDSSTDELNAVKSPDRKHKTLWRKSSGAVRLRTVGRPSVLSYISPDALL